MEKCRAIKGSTKGVGFPRQCYKDAVEGHRYCEDHLGETTRAIRLASRDILAKLEEIRQAMTLKSKSVDPMDHYTDRNGKTWRG